MAHRSARKYGARPRSAPLRRHGRYGAISVMGKTRAGTPVPSGIIGHDLSGMDEYSTGPSSLLSIMDYERTLAPLRIPQENPELNRSLYEFKQYTNKEWEREDRARHVYEPPSRSPEAARQRPRTSPGVAREAKGGRDRLDLSRPSSAKRPVVSPFKSNSSRMASRSETLALKKSKRGLAGERGRALFRSSVPLRMMPVRQLPVGGIGNTVI
jgi:hypothetical protein